MIASLRGTLEHRSPQGLVVNIGPVSLRVQVPASTLDHVGAVGEPVHLHTYLLVREDSLTLFGFHTEEERRMFELLIAVSGVGPRVALGVLSVLSPSALASTVAVGNVTALAQVPGVGKRTAERLVLELRGRLEREWGEAPVEAGAHAGDGDVVAALMALGYSATEARQAASRLDDASRGLPLEEKVRRALQGLGR